MFQDREEATRQLAARLAAYRGQHPLVLAIPRGAVPMGKLLAERLDEELGVAPNTALQQRLTSLNACARLRAS